MDAPGGGAAGTSAAAGGRGGAPRQVTYEELRRWTDDFNREERLLGEGGYGEVFLAITGRSGTHLAVKRLRPDILNDVTQQRGRAAAIDGFERERAACARINGHPHVASLLGFSVHGQQLLLVYEYAENGSLHRLLHGPFPGGDERCGGDETRAACRMQPYDALSP
jgi:serine/threonine protein kinase